MKKKTSISFLARAAMTLLAMLLVATAGYAGTKITLSNNDRLSGNVDKNTTVYIESGATVTFYNLRFESKYKCVVCKGSATIVLVGSNKLTCRENKYPAISVPSHETLTIRGTGSLVAQGGSSGAGIGGARGGYCGNIVIKGGDIQAKGGGRYGAGIGSGYKGKCGTITIGHGITSVRAQAGSKLAMGVGSGYKGKCGTITLESGLTSYRPSQSLHITPLSQTPPATDGTLTSATEDVILSDGAVLTGTGGQNTHVIIPDGTTVMFEDVNIASTDHKWAGITCEGDANIVLTGTNQVNGGMASAGIFVPEGATLTISGSGSLTATGRSGGAGIGSNKDTPCGSIIIEDGTVNAIGGASGAGIGGLCGANSEVEGSEGGVEEEDEEEDDDDVFDEDDDVDTGVFRPNIEIRGGTVTATGGFRAAGIGGSYNSDCSTATIEITGGTVVAQGGSGAAGIGRGAGEDASWGTIAIDGRIISVTATPGEGCSDAIDGTLVKPANMLDETSGSTRTLSNPKWTGGGTEDDPYIIRTPQELNLLAYRVNYSEGDYPEKYYKLGCDIAYPTAMTYDYDQDGVKESNFECIGYYDADIQSMAFRGHFDGDGHTISGIRLHRTGPGGDGDASDYQGLFGWILNGEVKNLRLRDVQITGCSGVGGIAGCMTAAKVSNCYVGNDVVVHAVSDEADDHGGIAGFVTWNGTIEGCVSAATVSNSPGEDLRYSRFGGIAGDNYGKLVNNLVLGANIHATYDDDSYGAIAGHKDIDAVMSNNYYSGCTVGSADSGGIGYYDDGSTYQYVADFTDNDGAVPALRDDASNNNALSLLAALPADLDLGWGAGKYPLSLASRMLWKDGDWNTLCLPFGLNDFTGTPLEDATVMELDTDGAYDGHKSGFEGSTIYLNFKDATTIEAGKPYIVKWTDGDNIESPSFIGVTVDATAPTAVTSEDGKVRFLGSYSPVDIFSADKDNLFLGAANTLYYPEGEGMTSYKVNAFRAYFHVDLTGAANVRAFVLGFGEDKQTGINSMDNGKWIMENEAGAWYDLSGRRLSDKPTQRGIYVRGGRKIIIK